MDPAELAAYLTLRDLLARQRLDHPDTLLAGKLAFAVDPHALEPLAPMVTARLGADPAVWQHVQRSAEEFLTKPKVAQVISLLGTDTNRRIAVAQDPQTSPVVVRGVVSTLLRDIFDEHIRPGDILPSVPGSLPAQTNAGCVAGRGARVLSAGIARERRRDRAHAGPADSGGRLGGSAAGLVRPAGRPRPGTAAVPSFRASGSGRRCGTAVQRRSLLAHRADLPAAAAAGVSWIRSTANWRDFIRPDPSGSCTARAARCDC